jgi:hypothetical protein
VQPLAIQRTFEKKMNALQEYCVGRRRRASQSKVKVKGKLQVTKSIHSNLNLESYDKFFCEEVTESKYFKDVLTNNVIKITT